MTPVLLAVPDVAQEPALVAAAGECGLTVSRRCVDAVDLLAAAAADPTVAVIVSSGLPRLSRDAVDRMAVGRRVVGLADADGDAAALRMLGIGDVVMAGSTPQSTLRAVAVAINSGSAELSDQPSDEPDLVADPRRGDAGRVVAVWGAIGAPGRTTVAIALAEAVSRQGLSVGLVDADTYGPSIAMALGLANAAGLVVACRHADVGSLTPDILRSVSHAIRPTWHVLGDVASASRWTDLRGGAIDRVWESCRGAFDVTVVDVGFCLEDDDDGSPWARRRNGVAVSAVSAADEVLAVADGSSLGAARLLEAWPRLIALRGGRPPILVGNRMPGRRVARQWTNAVRDLGVEASIHAIPDDAAAVSSAWSRAQAAGEGRRRSAVGRAVRELATLVVSG